MEGPVVQNLLDNNIVIYTINLGAHQKIILKILLTSIWLK